MDHGNWWLTEELDRMRREELRKELDHEQFLREHGLDLWSVLRRALVSGGRARPDEVAHTARPIRAGHRALARGPDLVEP